jgi:sugar phosphate isomerase/epimerase
MKLAEFAATIPDKFNVPGIEPWSHHFESVEPDYVRGLAAAFKKAGVHVVNIPCDVNVQMCGTPEQLMTALDTYSKWVDAAVILGSPSIRVHVPKTDPIDDVRCPVEGLKALADYGEKNNIVINLENDEATTENPYHVLKIIETANTPFLRSLPDFGNSRQLGDEAYNEQALKALFPHAYNISHVKDMETIEGKVLKADVAKIFAIANKAGYKGYFSMEWDTEGGDPYEATRQLIAASLKGLSS